MNSSIPIKMVFLTRRKFIEWSPAMLAASLEAGLKLRTSTIYYLKCHKKIGNNELYMEKILILASVLDSNNIGIIHQYIDKYLPTWMMITFINFCNNHPDFKLIYNIRVSITLKVDNLLYYMSLTDHRVDALFIYWNRVRPLGGIRELKPWASQDAFLTESYIVAIMDINDEIIQFNRFTNVKKVLKYGPGKGHLWAPHYMHDFKDATERDFITMLNEGWIIVFGGMLFNFLTPKLREKLYSFCRIIIEKGLSYFLFDEKFIYGNSNRAYIAKPIEDIDLAVTKDKNRNPEAYERWWKRIQMEYGL